MKDILKKADDLCGFIAKLILIIALILAGYAVKYHYQKSIVKEAIKEAEHERTIPNNK